MINVNSVENINQTLIMADSGIRQESGDSCPGLDRQAESCQMPLLDEIKSKVVVDAADLEKNDKHKKHQNGLVTHLLKSVEDAENGESADSGHGSSCQDCDCSTGDRPSVLSQVGAVDDGMTRLSLSDSRLANPAAAADVPGASPDTAGVDQYGIKYVVYESEKQMPDIIRLITKDLSEPYSIYTYRYFIHNWPKLCLLVSLLG